MEKTTDVNTEPFSSSSLIEDDLVAAAATFEIKHYRTMLLVLDSVDILSKETSKFLDFLQDFANDWADRGNLRIVFITRDGSALPQLMSRSSWSRADYQIRM